MSPSVSLPNPLPVAVELMIEISSIEYLQFSPEELAANIVDYVVSNTCLEKHSLSRICSPDAVFLYFFRETV